MAVSSLNIDNPTSKTFTKTITNPTGKFTIGEAYKLSDGSTAYHVDAFKSLVITQNGVTLTEDSDYSLTPKNQDENWSKVLGATIYSEITSLKMSGVITIVAQVIGTYDDAGVINAHESRLDSHDTEITALQAKDVAHESRMTTDEQVVSNHVSATSAHGATSAATVSRIVSRDANGRAKFADPSADDDVDTKGARNAAILVETVRAQAAESALSAAIGSGGSGGSGALGMLYKYSLAKTRTITVGTGPYGICTDGTNVLVANSDSNTVTQFLVSNGSIVRTITVGTGPIGICTDGTNVLVANYGSNTVTQFLVSDGSIVRTITVGTGPYGICTDGTNVFVANNVSNTVTQFLASDGSIVRTITVGTGPYGICTDGTNVFVANSGSNTVTQFLASDGSIVRTITVGTSPFSVCTDGTNLFVANNGSNTVTQFLVSDGSIVRTITVGTGPYGICTDGTNVLVANYGSNTVTQFLVSDGSIVRTITVGTIPAGICTDGTNVLVANNNSNTVTSFRYGTITLTASKLSAYDGIIFVDALEENTGVNLPVTVRGYKVICDCTGSYYVRVLAVGQSTGGVYLAPRDAADVYCDGSSVKNIKLLKTNRIIWLSVPSNIPATVGPDTALIGLTKLGDVFGEFNAATGVFTPKNSGILKITGYLSAKGTALQYDFIFKATSSESGLFAANEFNQLSGDYAIVPISITLPVLAGETIRLSYCLASGSNAYIHVTTSIRLTFE
jgi:hypothetical protein